VSRKFRKVYNNQTIVYYMYIRIKEKQEAIIKSAIKKAGSYRKLEKLTKIPKASIYRYEKLKAIPENRFKKLINFLQIKIKKNHLEILEDNWGQKNGGIKSVESKKKKGTFKKDLEKAQKSGIKKIKKWHKEMKLNNPKKYYEMQYEKFKKIGGYKFKTLNNEKVRNKFEKDVADKLKKLKVNLHKARPCGI